MDPSHLWYASKRQPNVADSRHRSDFELGKASPRQPLVGVGMLETREAGVVLGCIGVAYRTKPCLTRETDGYDCRHVALGREAAGGRREPVRAIRS